MTLTHKTRQYTCFAGLLLMTAMLSIWTYQHCERGWVHFRKGESLFLRERFAEAIPHYEKARAAGLTEPRHLIHLADARFAQGLFPEAAEVYGSILEGDPHFHEAAFKLARVQAILGHVDAAISILEASEKKWQEPDEHLLELAGWHRRVGSYRQAEEIYRTILSRSPGTTAALFRLAETLSWEGRYDESIALYRRLLNMDPGHRHARIHLARVLSWSGLVEEAIKEYRHFLGEAG